MDNKDVARVLSRIAILLELKGENPFKARAYTNAARTIERLNESLEEIWKRGELATIKGIGKNIAEKIEELFVTQKSSYLEELEKSVPEGLVRMLEIPGMGPKKIKAIYDKLGITSIGELEYACNENRLVDLPGFGAKTQEKILKGIEFLKQYAKYHLYYRAEEEALKILHFIQQINEVQKAEIAGSLRRKKEVVKDVDIVTVVSEKDRQSVADRICEYNEIQDIIGKGETKISFVLQSGIQVDVRMVESREFPFALHHFTGSKEHNTRMRQIAKEKGLKMNEYGLFQGEKWIECADEEEIFRKLSMQFIPPEMRENMGEIEMAMAFEIPKLVEEKDIKGMLHVHSLYSDGALSIEELANSVKNKGYEYLGISDHSKSSFYANGLSEERIVQQHEEIDMLNAQYGGEFTILKGIECDILSDGSLDYSDDVLKQFDFVIASVHQKLNMNKEEATRRIIKAIEHPAVNILGHPTGRLILSREGYELDWGKIFDAAKANQVAIEINANPLRLDMDWRNAIRALGKEVLVAINTDAHQLEGLSHIKYGIFVARKAGYSAERVINSFSLEQILKFFKK